MSAQHLFQLFSSTYHADPNVRKAAELEIRKIEAEPGMLITVFGLLSSDQTEMAVRQATAVYLKNRVRRGWDVDESRFQTQAGGPTNTPPIPQVDRDQIKAGILDALVKTPPQVRVQLASTLNLILLSDFPDKWSGFIENVNGMLHSPEVSVNYGGMRALLEVLKAYRWRTSEQPIVEQIVSVTFPQLIAHATSLINSPNVTSSDVGELLYVILKCYKTAINRELPPPLQQRDSIYQWGSLFLKVVEKQIPLDQLPADPEEREKSSWWKAKKWAYHSLNKLFARYGNPSQLPSNMQRFKPFADTFVVQFAPEILKAYLRETDRHVTEKAWLSNKVLHFIFSFYAECIKPKSTWDLLKPHVNNLVSRFVFPTMCFSDEEEELWEDDAVEYVRAKIDAFEDFGSPASTATSLLIALVQNRKKATFEDTLGFINSVVSSYPASTGPREKEGALRMFGALAHSATRSAKVGPLLEGFFVQYVIPDFKSEQRFLRARACDLVTAFETYDMKWSNAQNLEAVFHGVTACMTDPELPVRVTAARAIAELVNHEVVHNAMAPNAGPLMQELIKLNNQIELDTLSRTMSSIVENFAEEMLPFAVQLTEHLRDRYMRLMKDTIEAARKAEADVDNIDLDDTTGEDKTLAAMGDLATIQQILAITQNSETIMAQVEQVLLPLIAFSLESNTVEMYDDVLEILDSLTFWQKKISPQAWQIFELLYQSFKKDAIDFLGEMTASLDNFLSYGSDVFAQRPDYRRMVLDIFETAMRSDKLGVGDRIAACKIAEGALLHLRGQIDEAIPAIIQIVIQHAIAPRGSRSLKFFCVEIVLNAIYYNPQIALGALEQNNLTAAFFTSYLKDIEMFKRVHDKKISIMALASLLETPQVLASPSLQQGLPQVAAALLRNLATFPTAWEERKQLMSMMEEADDDDEEADIGDDGFEDEESEEGDIQDEDNEYLEVLAQEAERLREQEARGATDASTDDDLEEDDEIEEELMYESPLDQLSVYDRFRQLNANLQATQPQVLQVILSSLSGDQQELWQKVLQQPNELEEQQGQQAKA